jgi:phospholipase/carboxylesterase
VDSLIEMVFMEHINLSGPEFSSATGGKPRHLVILLHGYGADGNDLIGLAPVLAQSLPEAHFIAPHAPEPCEMSPAGRQWFSLRDWSPKAMLHGAQTVAPVLDLFINLQLTRFHLKDGHLALIGFSQGTMMALYAGLRRQEACAGIIGFSGSLIGENGITARPPVCLVHGDHDNVVPFGAMTLAEAALRHEGVPVESHARPGLAHGIDMQGMEIGVRFLKGKLA